MVTRMYYVYHAKTILYYVSISVKILSKKVVLSRGLIDFTKLQEPFFRSGDGNNNKKKKGL